MENSFKEKMKLKSNEELLSIIENKEDWQAEAVKAASTILKEREEAPSPIVKETKAPKYKKCPYCAEEILTEATKCKHCKEDLNTTQKRDKLNNTFIWLLVSSPLWGGILTVLLFGNNYFAPYLLLTLGLLVLDYIVNRNSDQSVNLILGIIFLPVYIIQRSKVQGGKKGYFWIWLVSLSLILLLVESYENNQYTSDVMESSVLTSRMSVEELTEQVKGSMEENFKEKQVAVKSLTLVKEQGNVYSGLLETEEPDGEFTYVVSVIYDGDTFIWEVIQ